MKKSILNFLFLAMCISMFAQDDVKSFDSFNKVVVATNVEVELIKSNEHKAEIWIKKGELNELKIEQIGNSLKIKWVDRYKWRNNRKAVIKLYFNELTGVSVSAGASVNAKDIIKSDTLEISASFQGHIALKVKANKVDANVNFRGSIALDGSTDHLVVGAGFNGSFKGKDLKASSVKVKAVQRGKAIVWAGDKIDASVAYRGQVSYKGNPSTKKISRNKWGGGGVRSM